MNISRDSKYGPEDVYALSGFYKDRKRSREYLELDQKIANCSLSFIIKHKIGKKIIDEFIVLWRLDEGRWVLQSKFSSKTYQEK